MQKDEWTENIQFHTWKTLDLFPLAIWKHFTSSICFHKNLHLSAFITSNYCLELSNHHLTNKNKLSNDNFQNAGVLKCIKVEENFADHIIAWWDQLITTYKEDFSVEAQHHPNWKQHAMKRDCNPTHGTDIEHHAAAFFTALNRELEFCTTANKKADWCRI